MTYFKSNIISICGIILMISLPLMPTLIYGMNVFELENVVVVNVGSVIEEEHEEAHSPTAPLAFAFQLYTAPTRAFIPSDILPPHLETHSPPPDLK